VDVSAKKRRRHGNKNNKHTHGGPGATRLDLSAAYEMGLTETSDVHDLIDEDPPDVDAYGGAETTLGIDSMARMDGISDGDSRAGDETIALAEDQQHETEDRPRQETNSGDTYGRYGDSGDTFGGDLASGEAEIAAENRRLFDDQTHGLGDSDSYEYQRHEDVSPDDDVYQRLVADADTVEAPREESESYINEARPDSDITDSGPDSDITDSDFGNEHPPYESAVTAVENALPEELRSTPMEGLDLSQTRPVTGGMVESEELAPAHQGLIAAVPSYEPPPLPSPQPFAKTMDWDGELIEDGPFVGMPSEANDEKLPFWKAPLARRTGEIAAAAAIGLVIGWAAWGGGNAPLAETPKDDAPVLASAATDSGDGEAPVLLADAASGTDKALENADGVKTPPGEAQDTVALETDESDQHKLAPEDQFVADAPPTAAHEEKALVAAADVPAAAKDECNVIVQSVPRNATIWIGKTRIGKTPYKGSLPCGTRTFRLTRKSYKAKTLSRTLASTSVNRVTTTLARAVATVPLRITSKPSRAIVRINGKRVGRTPLTTQVPKKKRARIVVTKGGHRVAKRNVVPKKKMRIRVALKRAKKKGKKSKVSRRERR